MSPEVAGLPYRGHQVSCGALSSRAFLPRPPATVYDRGLPCNNSTRYFFYVKRFSVCAGDEKAYTGPMEQPFDFDSGPEKLFVDKAHIRIINGLLHVTMQSAQELFTFVLPLPLAKQVSRAVGLQIDEIEAKTGMKFDGRLPNEPMLSPIDPSTPEGK